MLVGMQEIQDLLFQSVRDNFPEPFSVFRRRVADLLAGRDDFPDSYGQITSGEVWLSAAVEVWIGEHSDELLDLLTAPG
jgi:hypothetical protein